MDDGGEKPWSLTWARGVWRAEHPGNQRRQVVVSGTRRRAGEVDQIYKSKAG